MDEQSTQGDELQALVAMMTVPTPSLPHVLKEKVIWLFFFNISGFLTIFSNTDR